MNEVERCEFETALREGENRQSFFMALLTAEEEALETRIIASKFIDRESLIGTKIAYRMGRIQLILDEIMLSEIEALHKRIQIYLKVGAFEDEAD